MAEGRSEAGPLLGGRNDMSEQKTPGQLLADELLLKPKNSGELLEE